MKAPKPRPCGPAPTYGQMFGDGVGTSSSSDSSSSEAIYDSQAFEITAWSTPRHTPRIPP
ncbi:unnamed protein product [Eruca vesicaria subsp. sativa]|uniref:Uncharacterized protein n=1 Tax=Eruca vesicaria subsp. sativa TaxID=29727 RepID=A0ABC8L7F6_ERUVS|nr:unnamed protein product [Eruca vesicaria subsp. sativa]